MSGVMLPVAEMAEVAAQYPNTVSKAVVDIQKRRFDIKSALAEFVYHATCNQDNSDHKDY